MELVLNHRASTGLVVTEAFFGANLLYKRNELTDATGEDASFVQAVEALGVTALRYPGGTMTEKWGAAFVADPNTRPEHLDPGAGFVGLDEFITFTAENGYGATIVLPTAHLLLGEGDGVSVRSLDVQAIANLKAFVVDMVSGLKDLHPEAVIDAFEIGNEYFSDFVHMTSVEYGIVANAVAIAVQEGFDEALGADADQPQILAQMADQWGPDFDASGTYGNANLSWYDKMDQANTDVLDQFSHEAFWAIDGVIEHYYYGNTATALTTDENPLTSRDLDIYEINRDLEIWRSVWAMGGYGDLSVAVTEWGIGAGNEAQFGLKGAGVFLDMFEAMLRAGVDSAAAWPVELGGDHDLAGAHDERDGDKADALTPLGEAFRLMAENTIGTELLDNGFSAEDAAVETVEVNGFQSDEKFVFFLSSRSDVDADLTLDVSDYVTNFAAVSGELLSIEDASFSVDDPRAFAQTEVLSGDDLGNSTVLSVTLAPYEVLMVTYTLHDGVEVNGNTGADTLEGGQGNDVLHGEGGADIMSGGSGDDAMFGGSGDDVLSGKSGNDTLSGNTGNDELFGGQGHDMITGGLGNDVLGGGAGHDLLRAGVGDDWMSGGAGNDVLLGGFGDDLLIGGGDDDVMLGGLGADVFVFAENTGSDVVLDFETGSDRFDFTESASRQFDALEFATATRELADGEVAEGILVVHAGGEFLLAGLSLSDLSADDFLF
ncbi:MAG: calcium-binding protein [Maritimibacter sp.]